MRLRKSLGKLPARPEVQRCIDVVDRTATDEGKAVRTLSTLAPRRQTDRVTSSVAWAPKKPSGSTGWLRMSQVREMRAAFVRGQSNRTPKLEASYVRAFGVTGKA